MWTVAALLGLWLLAARAYAAPCEAERFDLRDKTSDALLQRARTLAAEQQLGRARFVYQRMLEQKLEEREATLGGARVDAWEHCYERAERTYRAWLEHAPRDIEARAGLIDVLTWRDQLKDAEREVDAALRLDPQSPELLRRRAVLYFRRGKSEYALRAAEHALTITPDDAELRALRDRIFFNQLRAYVRLDHYFGDYPDVRTASLSYWRRIYDVELTLDALLVERSGGFLPGSLLDLQYSASVSYHFDALATIGIAGGIGAPSRVLPRWIGRAWWFSEWTSHWSTTLSYSIWDYKADKTVHILTPAVTFTPSDQLLLELRYYGTLLVLHVPGEDKRRFVSTISLRGVAQLRADFRLGLSYTYGAQLDQAALSDIISFHSHVAAIFGEYRASNTWGLQPFASLEHRELTYGGIWVASLELGLYVRW